MRRPSKVQASNPGDPTEQPPVHDYSPETPPPEGDNDSATTAPTDPEVPEPADSPPDPETQPPDPERTHEDPVEGEPVTVRELPAERTRPRQRPRRPRR